MNNLKKNVLIILICLIIVSTLLSIGYYFFIFDDNPIKYKNRKNYILYEADESLIENYISKKENTLVIVMASWCSHCNNEAEELNKIMIDNPDYNIIVVSHDYETSEIEDFLNKHNYNWFVIHDSQRIIRKSLDPEADTVPCAYLVDTKGNLLSSTRGELNYNEIYNLYNQVDININNENNE